MGNGGERWGPVKAWIGLGANLGDPLARCREAVARLAGFPGVEGVVCSPFYRTAPVGGPEGQPWFVNGVAQLTTTLDPLPLWELLRRLEAELGRERKGEVPWGPRHLDLDLLLYGSDGEVVIHTREVVVPHPRLHQRRFVLAPLADLAPGLRHPVVDKTIDTLLREVEYGQFVERLPWPTDHGRDP